MTLLLLRFFRMTLSLSDQFIQGSCWKRVARFTSSVVSWKIDVTSWPSSSSTVDRASA